MLDNDFRFPANNAFAEEGVIFFKKGEIFHFGRKLSLWLPFVLQAAAKSSQAYCTLPATGHNAVAA